MELLDLSSLCSLLMNGNLSALCAEIENNSNVRFIPLQFLWPRSK